MRIQANSKLDYFDISGPNLGQKTAKNFWIDTSFIEEIEVRNYKK